MTEADRPEDWQAELLEKAKRGDSDARDRLLLASHDALLSHIRKRMPPKLLPRYSPEDILQETYRKAVAHVVTFEYRGPASFLGWLRVIATRLIIDLNQPNRPDFVAGHGPGAPDGSSCDDLIENLPGGSHGPGTKAAKEELRRAFHIALAQLPTDYQQVIKLRYLQELPQREVALRLDRSEDAVRGLCNRARTALRQRMDRLSVFI